MDAKQNTKENQNKKYHGERGIRYHAVAFAGIFLITSVILFFTVFLFPGFVKSIGTYVSDEMNFFTRTTTIELITILAVTYLFLRKKESDKNIKENPGFDEMITEVGRKTFFSFMIFASEVLLAVFVFFIASYFLVIMFDKLPFVFNTKEDLLTLLEVLLGFLGVIGVGIYYFISKSIEEKYNLSIKEMSRCFQQERCLSIGDSFRTQGSLFYNFYGHVYNDQNRKTMLDYKELRGFKQIKKAIQHANRYSKLIEGIPAEYWKVEDRSSKDKIDGYDYNEMHLLYLKNLYVSKNNLAFYIERKWNFIRANDNDAQFRDFLQKNGKDEEYISDKIKANSLIDVLLRREDIIKLPSYFIVEINKTKKEIDETFSI